MHAQYGYNQQRTNLFRCAADCAQLGCIQPFMQSPHWLKHRHAAGLTLQRRSALGQRQRGLFKF